MTTTKEKPATTRQREVYRWICKYIAKQGYAPTRREIMAGFGWNTPNAAMCHLVPLRKKGWITWTDGSARTIRPLKGGDA
jgi:repressor LexA